MAQNPLQKHFRQPKIFLKLPSGGVFCKPTTIQSDVEKLPIYGMTGMDEIMVKTPDALLNGEATVHVLQSCCPGILDARDISNIDINALLIAIRIASYGNSMNLQTACPNCQTENEFSINLNTCLEHFNQVTFANKIVVDDLVIKIKPLTYEQANKFSIEGFSSQRRLMQIEHLTNEEQQKEALTKEFELMKQFQFNTILEQTDSIEADDQVVTEKEFIKEFLQNCDATIISKIKEVMSENSKVWSVPGVPVACDKCNHEFLLGIDMDQSSFFDLA
jgi:hypothetical protein